MDYQGNIGGYDQIKPPKIEPGYHSVHQAQVRKPLENKAMEPAGNGIEKAQIAVIKYPGHALPPEYRNYIFGKWKRSLRHGNEYFRLMRSKPFNDTYDFVITSTLLRQNAVIRLAVLADSMDVALGWSLVEGDVLHYVFVQAEYRGLGLARKLVPTPINCFTHLTRLGMGLWNAKAPSAEFNPFK